MKKDPIITLLVVIVIILIGIIMFIAGKSSSQRMGIPNTNNLENTPTVQQYNEEQESIPLTVTENIQSQLPQIPTQPLTLSACQEFVAAYQCQEGTQTSEGLVGCDPQYFRVVNQCKDLFGL